MKILLILSFFFSSTASFAYHHCDLKESEGVFRTDCGSAFEMKSKKDDLENLRQQAIGHVAYWGIQHCESSSKRSCKLIDVQLMKADVVKEGVFIDKRSYRFQYRGFATTQVIEK